MKKIIKIICSKIPILKKLYVDSSYFIDHKREVRKEKNKIKTQLNKLLKDIKKAKKEKKIFYVLTPTHINLGDYAITCSALDMLSSITVIYYEITCANLFFLSKYKKLNVFNGNPIIINGGGNLGTLWFDIEQLTRDIIKSNSSSRIIILPNTIYYENNDFGKQELHNSIEIYNKHKNLTIYAREKISYEFMKPIYNNVKLCPDMVLRRNKCDTVYERSGCLICLRSDIEKTLDKKSYDCIVEQVKSIFNNNFSITDMYAEEKFDISEREKILDKKFTQFKKSQLVITDRLHGMIFAAITGTPCIVVNSKSPKVKGCYDWIKDLKYIRFCDDINKVIDIYNEIKDIKPVYNNKKLLPYYDKLSEDLKKLKQNAKD